MDLFLYDSNLRDEGYPVLCGIDEAGRGPLAGPVVAAAVVLKNSTGLLSINDSKKLSEKQREALYQPILDGAAAWGVGLATEAEIDEINILNATYLAMKRAAAQLVERLGANPSIYLVDGNRDPLLGHKTLTIVKGDGLSASIAAASVLAKVTRDRLMIELDKQYPNYLFAKHKGYPTKEHYARLDLYGPCEVYRRSFLKKWEKAKIENGEA